MNIPDEVVREMSEALWNAYIASPIARPEHKDISWQTIIENPDLAFSKAVIETARAEVEAIATIAIRWAREDQKEKDAELCKPQPDEAWEKDAVWAGNYIASRIRNQKD